MNKKIKLDRVIYYDDKENIIKQERLIKINGIDITDYKFIAYDGCHKLYVIEDTEDLMNAVDLKYRIFNIQAIEDLYNKSCELKFISNWKLNKNYVRQCENANFEYKEVE